MQGKIAAFFGSVLGKVIAGLVVVVLVLALISQCSATRTANTKAELGEASAEASAENAADAIKTAGEHAGRVQEADRLTRENVDAIESAEGSDAAIHPDAHAAGLSALCKRASYRDTADCVQRAGAGGNETP